MERFVLADIAAGSHHVGAAFPETTGQVEKNIAAMGFKVSDIKVIFAQPHHGDQSGAAAYFKEKSGAQVMAVFAEIPLLEHVACFHRPPWLEVPADTRQLKWIALCSMAMSSKWVR